MVIAELCRDLEVSGQELIISSSTWRKEGKFIDVIKWLAIYDQPTRNPEILHEWIEEPS